MHLRCPTGCFPRDSVTQCECTAGGTILRTCRILPCQSCCETGLGAWLGPGVTLMPLLIRHQYGYMRGRLARICRESPWSQWPLVPWSLARFLICADPGWRLLPSVSPLSTSWVWSCGAAAGRLCWWVRVFRWGSPPAICVYLIACIAGKTSALLLLLLSFPEPLVLLDSYVYPG